MSGETMRRLRTATLTLAAAAVLGAGGCWEGGLNLEESKPGNQDGGNDLSFNLSVSEDGRFLVLRGDDGPGTPVWSVDLQTWTAVALPLPGDAFKMVFGPGSRAYFLRLDTKTPSGKPWTGELREVSLATGKAGQTWTLGGAATALSLDAAGTRIAAWSPLPFNAGSDGEATWAVTVVPVAGGPVRTLVFADPTEDVRWVPGTGELAVVTRTGGMASRVTLVRPDGTPRAHIDVPNCASSLQIAPDGRTGMIAPTHCSEDPVSVLDLAQGRFVRNLPGFGPVAYTADGSTAVAFARRDDLARVAGLHTEAAYSLLFIDVETLALDVLELGDDLPIYSVTPDGQVVLVYSVLQSATYDGIVLVDVATRTLRETSGPEVGLSEFVMTPDGELVYLIDGGLFRLDVGSGMISYVALPCRGPGEPARCNPDVLNLLPPDGEVLVLGYLAEGEIALYDAPAHELLVTFRLDAKGGHAPVPLTLK